MKYLSVCSGVGTDHVAWAGLGFTCVGFAEIEPFPSAVLAHHFPTIPNFGDFTGIQLEMLDGKPDVLVGGTPCQSFSIAGQRAGLDDPRGNLTLEFARLARRLGVPWIVWENVPGVLSSGDFGAIISTFEECGYSVCWRVLDAQHYGVPQRRRRVFLVGHLGDDWRPSAAVLLEPASMRGNPPKGGTKGQEVAGTLGGGSGSRGSSEPDQVTFIPVEVDASRVNGCLTTTYGSKNYSNHEEVMSGSLVSGAWVPGYRPLPVPLAVRTAQTGANGIGVAEDVSHTLDGAQGQAIAFSAKDYAGPLSPTLRSGTHDRVQANGGVMPAVALSTVVRRLTPRECERLQGLPDDWTLVPYRGKPAADAPRYKAIGNGMAAPVVKWIGQRLLEAMATQWS